MKLFLVLCSVGLIALGCNHDKAPDAAASAAVSAAPAPPAASIAPVDTAAAAAPTPSAADPTPVAPAAVAAIPAEEDFEPQAATTITVANASQQLTQLEKEIGK
jgi:hypothetical protein